MCIAVLNSGKQISENDMYLMWLSNRDGAGLVWHDGFELRTLKMLVETDSEFAEFRNHYKKAFKEATSGVVIHFRMATTGEVHKLNCHPFHYEDMNGNVNALVHNGMLQGYGHYNEFLPSAGVQSTDTYNFIHKNMNKVNIYNPFQREKIERLIGSYNKFIIMTDTGDVFILNASSGIWLTDGNWYSNQNYVNFHNRSNYYKNYIKH
tara:strand:- start:3713 stop:4333 length:621 start_codon:yes stop_codon:yes gene_type:complete